MTQHILTISNYLRSPIEGLLNLLNDLKNGIARRSRIQQTIKELRQLNDYELNDIGISRGDIYAIANGDPDHKKSVKSIDYKTNSNLKGWV